MTRGARGVLAVAGDLRSFVPRLSGATDDSPLDLHVDAPACFCQGPHGQIYVASLAGPVSRLVEP